MSGGQIMLLRSVHLHGDLNACFQNSNRSPLVVIPTPLLAVEASAICASELSLGIELRGE